jgi:hypothetical protein
MHDIACSWRGTQVSFGESNFKMKGKMTDLGLNNFNNRSTAKFNKNSSVSWKCYVVTYKSNKVMFAPDTIYPKLCRMRGTKVTRTMQMGMKPQNKM